MRKILLIPTLSAVLAAPMVSMVGCGQQPEPTPPEPVHPSDCLTFTALTAASIHLWNYYIKPDADFLPDLCYSVNDGPTKKYKYYGTYGEEIIIGKGSKIKFWGNNPNGFSFFDGGINAVWNGFKIEGLVNVSGNIMSLIDNGKCETDTIPCPGCFQELFSECGVINAKDLYLPSNLKKYCYFEMFEGCHGLMTAPNLNATTLQPYCYSSMFSQCASLTRAPELKSIDLAEGCYYGMFSECYSLTTSPVLPASELEPYCYSSMFSLCVGLTQAPELKSIDLAEGCYLGMFTRCDSLTAAPNLPATGLEPYCYAYMFKDCRFICQPGLISATSLDDYSCYEMFANCISMNLSTEGDESKKFFTCPSTDTLESPVENMFNETHSLFISPEATQTIYWSEPDPAEIIKVNKITKIENYDCLQSWMYPIKTNFKYNFEIDLTNWECERSSIDHLSFIIGGADYQIGQVHITDDFEFEIGGTKLTGELKGGTNIDFAADEVNKIYAAMEAGTKTITGHVTTSSETIEPFVPYRFLFFNGKTSYL